MPKSAINIYGFINARLRAKLSLLLDEEKFNQLIKASTLEETLGYLRDTPYESLEKIYKQTGDIKLAELELLNQEIEVYTSILKSVTDVAREIVKALMLKYEIENLKNVIRIFFTRVIKKENVENQIHYIYRKQIVHRIDVDSIVNATDISSVLDALKNTPYQKIVEEEWPGVAENGSLFFLEVKLDHFYYKNLLKLSNMLNPTDRSILNRLVGVEIDIQNIDWIARLLAVYSLKGDVLRHVLMPGGLRFDVSKVSSLTDQKEIGNLIGRVLPSKLIDVRDFNFQEKRDVMKSLELLEALLEEIIIKETKKALAGYPFTIGIILAYHTIKSREIRKIRAILNAKYYNFPPDTIKRSI